ncbi:MAG: acetyl-CoA synthetase [Thermoplasmata archaeon]|jgi:acetyl-CoA synthetase|nr:acetyl-CoA synthetase [Thermoplasmata archaeon]
MPDAPTIESLLAEERAFPPPPAFRDQALVRDPDVYARAAADPETFWSDLARELLWIRPWQNVLEWDPPHAKWFVGGKLNVAENCAHRHARGPRRAKPAIVWEGEPGETRTLTYAELSREVGKLANALRELGIAKGDRVAIYLPMVPEIAIAMLACAHVGAIHSVVFGGFSAQALASRVQDAGAKLVITADGGYRRGNVVPLKLTVDEAVAQCPTIERVLVLRRTGKEVPMTPRRDVWWHDLVPSQSEHAPPEPMDAEDPLYTLYTSGTTGKPKGVLHTTGGYLTGVYATTKMVFDLREDDIYFCTADCGWVTGHSYVVYGPLANGATVVMYEGSPDFPDKGRFWDIVQKHGVTIFYTAPTAIRQFMQWGPEWPARHDLSTLRLLGTVGEPINPEAWMWYRERIGGGRCPIVDTWWQTETGMIMITTLPGVDPARPGFAGRPFPGVEADILDEQGQPVDDPHAGGYLVLKKPWPAMFRTLWNDDGRYQKEYWSRFPGAYFPKDGAKRDRGYYMILGRVDDVIKVAGHRIGTMEVESALVSHPAVAEAAVIGKHDPIKGEAIVAYVIPRAGAEVREADLREHVAKTLGAIARPERVILTPDLPKTRSGKIMRRLLRDVAEGRPAGDATTLADPAVVERLRQAFAK